VELASTSGLGTVLFAPFPIKLWEGKIREPDIVFMPELDTALAICIALGTLAWLHRRNTVPQRSD